VAGLFFEVGNYIQARNWYLSALAIDRNNLLARKGLWEIGTQSLVLAEKSMKDIFFQNVVDAIRILQKELNELKNISSNSEKVALPMFFTETTEPNTSQSAVSQAILPRQNTPEGEVEKQDKIVALKDLRDKARLRGDYEEAILIPWKILARDGKNVEAWVELTECLQKTNQYDIAEMAIQETIKLKPECVDFYMTYLDIVLCTHSRADYILLLKNVKHRFSMDPEIRLRWASAQEIYMDNAAGAKRSYEKFLKLAPSNHPEISRIKHLLQASREGYDEKK
jgi:tetratricopeptide (TPR) repeat protein